MRLARGLLVVCLLMPALCAFAVAGTTGVLRGRVFDVDTGRPLQGAIVTAVSPSQTEKTTTDASGSYIFVSLPPATYNISVDKHYYGAAAIDGIAVVSDQTRDLDFHIRGRFTIARVRTRPTTSVVQPGTTSDIYSITPQLTQLTQTLGGSGSLNQAYAALVSVPGVNVPQGQQGWYQFTYIRGGAQDQAGWEFDGIPINRSYDNAPQTMLSTLGQQELQVYTGGVPATADAPGIAGYVNQVIKRGTYPGFGTIELGIGGPAFRHELKAEAGGATPDRRFSYYVGLLGANQDYRYLNQWNGAGAPGFFYPLNIPANNGYVYDGSAPAVFSPGASYGIANTQDRESVVNLHFGIPRRGGATDDVQLLYATGGILLHFFSSMNELGVTAPLPYADGRVYTGAMFAPVDPNAIAPYYFPSSPTSRSLFASMDPNMRDANENGMSVLKVQYQRNISSSSFLRIYGYSLYSNWFQNGPISGALPWGDVVSDYELDSHLAGVNASFTKELGRHLFTLETMASKGTLMRYSPTGGFPASSASAAISNWIDSAGNCYDPVTGLLASCFDASVRGTMRSPTLPVTAPANSPGVLSGARWIATESGYHANIDTVAPLFTAVALNDDWRASDRWSVNLGLRAETYRYNLADTQSGYPARAFWFAAYNREYCFGPNFAVPVPRGYTAGVLNACPAGTSPVKMVNDSGGAMSATEIQPRASAAYEVGPNDVLRGSYGVYARPANTAWAQFNTQQQDLAQYLGTQFYAYGFTTPRHDERPDRSYNADLSWEHRIPGTTLSFKISPFYRSTADQLQSFDINPLTGLRAGLNVGHLVASGVEVLVQAGRPVGDGWLARLAYTHTRARIRYSNFSNGRNVIDNLNSYIEQFNSYTSACAGSSPPAFCGSYTGNAQPSFAVAGGTVTNPYYSMAPQPLFDRSGWYTPYDVIPAPFAAANGYETPDVASLVLAWTHGPLRITPAFTYSSGAKYGSPLVWPGYIPQACKPYAGTANANPTTCTSPAAYQLPYIFTPDPYTGQFDTLGAFRQPWRFTANLSIDYDISSRVHATLALTNLIDSCHLRGYPWEYPGICVYAHLPSSALAPAGNFDPNPPPQLKYPYAMWLNNTEIGGLGTAVPFEANFTLQFKL